MKKEKFKRIVAFYLALNIIFQVVSPTAALALTSGPGQPEMASFEPVGTTEMVDIFSGDFNYNIPLMTVPGPNGGYPINLAYHSGIGMDDEASWTGLGWNINPGVISRQMRGLPDDFDGTAKINKKVNINPNRTASLGFGLPIVSVPEIWGFQYEQNMNLGLMWNNYQGIGFTQGMSTSLSINSSNSVKSSFGASLDYNSFAGETTLSPSISLSSRKGNSSAKFSAGYSVGSLSGLKSLNFSGSYRKHADTDEDDDGAYEDDQKQGKDRSVAASVTFASSSFVPHSEMPTTGFNVSSNFKLGLDIFGVAGNFQANIAYSENKNEKQDLDFNAYGYLYSNQRTSSINTGDANDDYRLMDFNREKDIVPSKDIPSMPASMANYDIYMVKGQGIGGSFRPYRTDIGLFVDPEIKGENTGGNLGAEVGLGVPTFNIGVNLALNYSKSYTGPWKKSDLYDDIKDKTHKGHVYFKSANELVANENEESDFDMSRSNFTITSMIDVPDFSDISINPSEMAELMSPIVEMRANNNGIIGNKNHYQTKRTISQLMSYKTFNEINSIPGYKDAWVNSCIYVENEKVPVENYIFQNCYSTIGEMSVINPDGNKYIYALPAMNTKQKEVTFSIEHGESRPLNVNDKIINFTGTDNSLGNTQLDDHFFSSTEIPSYVHSYMLTAIVSPDYVDLTGNGPSNDDFGYWVKFNYTRTSDAYKWRAPFAGANFLKGYLSTDNDDKAGYTYGEKEVWYLNSIETKTHYAKFEIDPRQDSKGASSEGQQYDPTPNTSQLTGEALRKLTKISLFSKKGGAPVKEVHFDYSYDLCKNTWNSTAAGQGKLTLKKVWFTYQGNNKGALSPYVFDYKETGTEAALHNPEYNILKEDRWGNYKRDSYSVDNTLFPYTFQGADYNENAVLNEDDVTERNAHASAWSLKGITLPSGGKIEIDYEADDYAFVHEKEAMQMVKIVGFGGSANSPISNTMSGGKNFVFFELDDQTTIDPDDVKRMVAGISDLYFNVFVDLKNNGSEYGGMKKDYVDGYASIDHGSTNEGITTVNGTKYGYFKIVPVSVKDNGEGGFTHPFRKAAWQYLKLERKDILFPGSDNDNASTSSVTASYLIQLANSMIGAFESMGQLFSGYYNYCATNGIAMNMSSDKPSFVKLKSHDGIKYGGGHRVKEIAIKDTWEESDTINPGGETESKYGQQYSYRLPDGRSSGVASYEPLIGGDEIPHRKPIRYSSPYFINKNQNLYMEEPIGEGFYPAPMVGYSRVVVKNINPPENVSLTKTLEGTTVYEFYTTKDFPYQITRGGLTHEKFNPKIPIPFIGSVGFENHGFSQWMNVVTNDMHGKAKSIATYAAGADVNNGKSLPVSSTKYIYNTKSPYSPSSNNILNCSVNALFNDGYYRNTPMGLTSEHYIDMRENSGVTMNQGLQTNVDVTYPAIIVPTFCPIIDYSETLFKSIVAMHVTSQTGILMETSTFNEGSTVVSKNLMFDAYTGKPILTTVTNDFDKPIYSYNYAAQWAYEGMGNAYKNDRATFSFTTDVNGNMDLTSGNAVDLFYEGDEILINDGGVYTTAWISKINDATHAELLVEDGHSFESERSGLTGIVLKSGRKNQQSVSNAFIVSLTDPVNDRKFDLFDQYNIQPSKYNGLEFTTTDCASGIIKDCIVSLEGNAIIFTQSTKDNPEECNVKVLFPNGIPSNWANLTFKKSLDKVYASLAGTQDLVATGKLIDECGLSECLDGVLNAGANEFSHDKWVYDYVDVEDPSVRLNGNLQLISSLGSSISNPYRLGQKGIWRMDKAFAYQTERMQDATNPANPNITKIQKDGTYKDFVLFDWRKFEERVNFIPNQKWTMVNEVTRYSPYGFEIENKNALGIYTAALYGYSNSLQTAIANNAKYHEIGYESFEDQSSASYSYLNGHLNLIPTGNQLNSTYSHTGKKSMEIPVEQTYTIDIPQTYDPGYHFFQPPWNKRYVVSAWFKVTPGAKPQITLNGVNYPGIIKDNVIIDGWQKIEATFFTESANSGASIVFSVTGTNGVSYIDDIRIQPFNSTMKTFVYDPKTLWLVAELDNQNYATFYNYDEEGTLTQVKKETINGVQTLKTTRSNIKRNPNP